MDKINKARKATYEILESEHINKTIGEKMAKVVIDKFMENTTNFESNPCLNSKEDSIPKNKDNDGDANCYYRLSIDIWEETEKSFPNISVIVGEISLYGNYNANHSKYVAIVLGPLLFIIIQY